MAERARRIAMVVALAGVVVGPRARAERVETPELDAERDQLLDKIIAGTDYDASVKRFAALVGKRDQLVATSAEAREKQRQQAELERAQRDARNQLREEYKKTADYDVSWRCTLSPDPAHPVPSTEGRFKGDWGEVVRKESIRYAPKNDLDEGEPATLYEIAGKKQRYLVRGEKAGYDRKKPFVAAKGDLVLVCAAGERLEKRLPPAWGDKLTDGFAVRLAAPPKVVKKARWNPIHVTGAALFWIVKDVKWKYPDDANLLFVFPVGEDLGDGKYKIDIEQGLTWILDVPPALRKKELLQPGRYLWAILGHHRFDKSYKTLVLTAEDIEERYIDEK